MRGRPAPGVVRRLLLRALLAIRQPRVSMRRRERLDGPRVQPLVRLLRGDRRHLDTGRLHSAEIIIRRNFLSILCFRQPECIGTRELAKLARARMSGAPLRTASSPTSLRRTGRSSGPSGRRPRALAASSARQRARWAAGRRLPTLRRAPRSAASDERSRPAAGGEANRARRRPTGRGLAVPARARRARRASMNLTARRRSRTEGSK